MSFIDCGTIALPSASSAVTINDSRRVADELKPTSGTVDASEGLIWRHRDLDPAYHTGNHGIHRVRLTRNHRLHDGSLADQIAGGFGFSRRLPPIVEH